MSSQCRQMLLPLLPPIAATILQWMLWPWLKPLVLVLFYPAVFFSSWIGGRKGGLAGTGLSIMLVWYVFVPPEWSITWKPSNMLVGLAAFGMVGTAMAFLHEKVKVARATLELRVQQRTLELQRSTEVIRENKALMSAVIGSAMDAIISVDERQNIVLFNKAAEKMFRCSSAEALGQPLGKLIPERHRHAHQKHVSDFGETNITSRSMQSLGKLHALRADGEEFPIEASISHAEVNGHKHYTAIIRDISDRLLAEEQLRIQGLHARSRLRLAHRLEQAASISDILNAVLDELQNTLRLNAVWFYVISDDEEHMRLVRAGKRKDGETIVHEDEMLNIKGDRMLEEIATTRDLVVVEDAQTDERTNKAIVGRNGNRTIINMPVILSERRLGALGSGTFHDEGVRTLSPAEREYFTAVAVKAATVLDRVMETEKRRQVEESLRESEARYRGTLDQMMEGCQIIGKDFRYLYLNEELSRQVRKPAGELLGRTLMDCFPGIEDSSTFAAVRRCLENREVEQMESTFSYPDGGQADFQFYLQPVPEGVFILSLDISARKKVEKRMQEIQAELERRVAERTTQFELANAELQSHRAELQSLFESLPGLYLILTPELEIVTASDAYLKATMTTRQDIAGRGLFEVFPDNPQDPSADGVSNLRASLQRVLRDRVADTMPIQKYDVRGPDGEFHERHWTPVNSPLFDSHGSIKFIIHRAEDVTDFVLRKKKLELDRGPLDIRMQQMEAEIFQGTIKIQEANKKLEAANKELESFSYSVSHDLRAPLRAVDGFSKAVVEDYGPQLPEECRRMLQVIRNNAQKMGCLIDDLLSFSRLSRMPLNKQAINTPQLVSTVWSELAAEREGREVDFQMERLPDCNGDPVLLRQVWINLLSNALKYSRRREKAVVVVGCETASGHETFFVRDNGAGFDMRYAHKLFGVFQRLHRVEDYEGTGVGLAIVQRVINRHGGRVWAESAPDHGATFHFTLEQDKTA